MGPKGGSESAILIRGRTTNSHPMYLDVTLTAIELLAA